jgi:hypothetical protein
MCWICTLEGKEELKMEIMSGKLLEIQQCGRLRWWDSTSINP